LHIDRIIWLDDVIEKLERKHRVEKSEVWELLQSKAKFRFVEKDHREGENVYAALGRTEAGRS
jgi:energy-converting hydrogenase A subunit M